jgi:uncharacterized protein YyaL (SSP411 family)
MNMLIHEKSPYLLQHANNPVDWYPWCDEAFKKARELDRPIFLSIGYSTCHWCHVMERESFEDNEVAKLLNDNLISIKVDREERPDLDNIYMSACQMLTGSGGWPLTIIMTPDKIPFYTGTYFPKNGRSGRMGMMELIPWLMDLWHNRRGEVQESASKIEEALNNLDNLMPGKAMDASVTERCYKELYNRFDEASGGFSIMPKFPSPHNILFLLRHFRRTGNEKALQMAEKTLFHMRLGGIYDHVGFGFHRYSTDSRWLLPHFEKMLYDQAMVIMAYLEAYQVTGKRGYASTADEIFRFVLRDLTAPEGGFYSAIDADSEGAEGKFYLWREDELKAILGPDAGLIIEIFNVKKNGNFSEESTGEITGSNILYLAKPVEEIALEKNMPLDMLQDRVSKALNMLFVERKKRVHPHMDDKILTDWNGLMIAALALGTKVLKNSGYASSAIRAADFIIEQMRSCDAGLLHRYRGHEAKINGNADDYAFFIWGLIELYEATAEARFLDLALELNDHFLAHFYDRVRGGLFFTPDNGEPLPVRKREIYDGAIPSSNSAAMLNLLRLGRITKRADLEKYGVDTATAFSDAVKKMPSSHTFLMYGIEFLLNKG